MVYPRSDSWSVAELEIGPGYLHTTLTVPLSTTRSYFPTSFEIHELVWGAHVEATVGGEGAELD